MVPVCRAIAYTEQAGDVGRPPGGPASTQSLAQNNFLLDGVDNNSISTNVQELTTQLSRPSVDAIDEFKVVTSPYAAEYGWSPGAAIIVNTKSGTNRIRGTAYDFYRDDRMDTINYFAKAANQAKATNKQNQFGGNRRPDSPHRFFFGDYEAPYREGVAAHRKRHDAAQSRGVFTTAVRDRSPAALPNTRFPPIASMPWRRDPLLSAAQHHRAKTHQSRRTSRRSDVHLRWIVRSDSEQRVLRYLGSNRSDSAGWFDGVPMVVDVGVGPHFLDSHAVVAAGTRAWRPYLNASRGRTPRGTTTGSRTPSARAAWTNRLQGVPNPPSPADRRHRHRGHIRLGSPNFMRRPHTSQVQGSTTRGCAASTRQVRLLDVPMPTNISTRAARGTCVQRVTGNASAISCWVSERPSTTVRRDAQLCRARYTFRTTEAERSDAQHRAALTSCAATRRNRWPTSIRGTGQLYFEDDRWPQGSESGQEQFAPRLGAFYGSTTRHCYAAVTMFSTFEASVGNQLAPIRRDW